MKAQMTKVSDNCCVFVAFGAGGKPKIWCMFRDSRTGQMVAAFGSSDSSEMRSGKLHFKQSRELGAPRGNVHSMQEQKRKNGYRDHGRHDIYVDAQGRFVAMDLVGQVASQSPQAAAQPKPSVVSSVAVSARVSDLAKIPSHLDFRA